MWNLAEPSGTWVCLAVQNFAPIDSRGWERGPQNFLAKSHPAGANPLIDFQVVRGFYTPIHPALVFYIWDDSLHWLQSCCWETARQSFTQNFSEHPVGKNDWYGFNGLDILYHHAKFGKIVLRAPAVGAKMWCYFLSRSESGALCVRGVHSLNKHSVAVYGSISMLFQRFFSQWIALSDALHSSHFHRQAVPQFLRNFGRKFRKLQKSAKKFVRTTSYR